MTEKQKDCIIEIQELMIAINTIVKKHGLEDEFIACLAIGFLDLSSQYTDEYGDERANMNLLSSFAVSDEEELDDLLSYCVEAYRMQEEEKDVDTSSIDYWINFGRRDGDIN
jgi:hypothetical protein|tara:strand:+ start:683 stop:1018 length:336 start_codon:yes stop_codon:yes gene_type:complete